MHSWHGIQQLPFIISSSWWTVRDDALDNARCLSPSLSLWRSVLSFEASSWWRLTFSSWQLQKRLVRAKFFISVLRLVALFDVLSMSLGSLLLPGPCSCTSRDSMYFRLRLCFCLFEAEVQDLFVLFCKKAATWYLQLY